MDRRSHRSIYDAGGWLRAAAAMNCKRVGQLFAGVLLVALFHACAREETLPPVALPDLSALAPSVQKQIRDQHAKLSNDTRAAPADRAAAYGGLARLLLAAKFGDEATSCYLRAEALQPGDMRWPYFVGHAYRMQGNRQLAAAAFERAAKLQPSALPPLVWLGQTYLDDDEIDAAQSAFARALSVQPESAPALFGAGRVALARGAHADAIRFLERTLA